MQNKEISVLSLFFSVLSDSLATIAAANLLTSNTSDAVIFEERLR